MGPLELFLAVEGGGVELEHHAESMIAPRTPHSPAPVTVRLPLRVQPRQVAGRPLERKRIGNHGE